MKVALIGATGYIGSALLQETLARGHSVTALVRNPAKLQQHDRLTGKAVDLLDTAALTEALKGHDVVLASYNPGHDGDDVRQRMAAGGRSIIDATKAAGVPRLLTVGGAGSLQVAPGVQVLDNPEFPAQWRPGAEGTRDFLHMLRDEPTLDWTMLSPAALIEPGGKEGDFRLGLDDLVVDAAGKSRITTGDYAVAMVDELENPKHPRRRFTLAY